MAIKTQLSSILSFLLCSVACILQNVHATEHMRSVACFLFSSPLCSVHATEHRIIYVFCAYSWRMSFPPGTRHQWYPSFRHTRSEAAGGKSRCCQRQTTASAEVGDHRAAFWALRSLVCSPTAALLKPGAIESLHSRLYVSGLWRSKMSLQRQVQRPRQQRLCETHVNVAEELTPPYVGTTSLPLKQKEKPPPPFSPFTHSLLKASSKHLSSRLGGGTAAWAAKQEKQTVFLSFFPSPGRTV